MVDWNKRDKSIVALARINQANAIIDNIKDSELGNITSSINTLRINYELLYANVENISQTITTLNEQMQNISKIITTLNQRLTTLENK